MIGVDVLASASVSCTAAGFPFPGWRRVSDFIVFDQMVVWFSLPLTNASA
jgi:hypothetical protein